MNNVLSSLSSSYSYEDINKVQIGVKVKKKYQDMYYKIYFNDGKKIDIFDGEFFNDTEINSLIKINEIIINKNIKREVDDKYLEVAIIDYNEELQKEYRKIFK